MMLTALFSDPPSRAPYLLHKISKGIHGVQKEQFCDTCHATVLPSRFSIPHWCKKKTADWQPSSKEFFQTSTGTWLASPVSPPRQKRSQNPILKPLHYYWDVDATVPYCGCILIPLQLSGRSVGPQYGLPGFRRFPSKRIIYLKYFEVCDVGQGNFAFSKLLAWNKKFCTFFAIYILLDESPYVFGRW